MMLKIEKIVSRGRGRVSKEVAAFGVRSLEDVDNGLLQRALPRLVHRLQWDVSLGPAPSRHSGCLA